MYKINEQKIITLFSAYTNSYTYPTTYALPAVQCEAGWIPYHTACYKFYNQPMSFEDANAQCQKGTQKLSNDRFLSF